MTRAADLEDRIADAFDQKLGSKELSALLEEVAAAEEAANATHADAKERALDPTTRPGEVAKARKEMEDAEFRASRMSNAAVRLRDVLSQAEERERAEAERKEREGALKERDELAADLREFGELTDKMAALLTRLSRNNRRLHGHHESRTGSAESVARGIALNTGPSPARSIIEHTKLVSFNGSASWPPHDQNNWVHYP